MTSPLSKAKELIRLRELATSGEIVYGPSEMHNGAYWFGFVVGPDPMSQFRINKCGEFLKSEDAQFNVFSANHSTEICQALIDAVEALEQYGDYHWQDCSIAFSDKCDCGLPKVAKETLSKIGGGE